ncbi:MAG: DUF3147 family protein [Candidatus Rifleibacteriota bacterium]
MQYFIKIAIVLLLIVAITELAKKNQTAAAVLASLPITSLIAIIWLKQENTEIPVIMNLCRDIFWMVIPSLVFFLIFPIMLKQGYDFWASFIVGCGLTTTAYFAILRIINYFP